jgi:hypothetical protein
MRWITDSHNYVLMKFNECYLPGQNTFKPLTFTVPISCSLSLMRIRIWFFTLMQIWLPKIIWIQIWICKLFLLFIILATFEYFFTFFQTWFCTVYKKITVFKCIILVLQFMMFMFSSQWCKFNSILYLKISTNSFFISKKVHLVFLGNKTRLLFTLEKTGI